MSHRTALLLLALALAGCGRAKAPGATDARWFGSVTPPRRDVLRFNNGSEPETIDPGVMSGQPDGRIAHLLFEGLTAPDPRTLQPTPAQAYRWESSPDARTWTFHLRPGLAWTDGARVTAHDFVYAWRRVLSPATASRSAGMLYPIENAESYHKGAITDSTLVGVRAADDSTLVVRLAAPTAYFLFLTGHETYLPVPRTAIERWGGAWTDPGHIVTNGPFTLLRHSHGEKIELARNARYWDAGHVRLEGITAYAVDDLNTSTNLYKAGAIDWNTSGSIPAPYLPYLRHYADFVTGEYQATYFYCVNTTRHPFDDVHVRRALDLAIDREAIARELLKGTRRAWGRIVPSGYPGYEPPPAVQFDSAAAQRELALAGYPGGRGFPRFTILFSTSEDHRRIAEAIQAMWKRTLNVPVELQNQEWASYLAATTGLHYDVARRSWIGDYLDPVTFLEPLRTGDGNNRTGWGDPKFDALLRAAAREPDAARRFALLRDAEAMAIDAAVFLPIYHYSTQELVKPYVRGIYHTALDVHPLTRVWIDRDSRRTAALAERAR